MKTLKQGKSDHVPRNGERDIADPKNERSARRWLTRRDKAKNRRKDSAMCFSCSVSPATRRPEVSGTPEGLESGMAMDRYSTKGYCYGGGSVVIYGGCWHCSMVEATVRLLCSTRTVQPAIAPHSSILFPYSGGLFSSLEFVKLPLALRVGSTLFRWFLYPDVSFLLFLYLAECFWLCPPCDFNRFNTLKPVHLFPFNWNLMHSVSRWDFRGLSGPWKLLMFIVIEA